MCDRIGWNKSKYFELQYRQRNAEIFGLKIVSNHALRKEKINKAYTPTTQMSHITIFVLTRSKIAKNMVFWCY